MRQGRRALPFDYPLRDEGKEGISFSCAVLDQVYDRHKAYVGVYVANDLEFTPAKRAWVLDLKDMTLKPYARVSNVYCPNFIAD